ncbi:hypothetical protein N7509_009866 [Penicillium cosmopolitanum]|uniref:Uncharacterized protein n=1 Tax=Penicillium cosmopolitanum TaxID=1131564 RepID=A0A9W9VQE6_9EURO|nr:uncharacterized protein N7509_009866 [Penicillium cosmopolitanum]KAJ5387325.1 hypothetical protein N7509_009866 [Penicillium cosmopolitanum]
MKFNNLIMYLALHLSFVAGNPVDLSGTTAGETGKPVGLSHTAATSIEARGLVPRSLSIAGTTDWYCWAISSGVLANPGYATSLANLHIQMFAFFNAPGSLGPDEFKFTSTRNNGVIWTAKVIVLATTQAFTIADAINDLYASLNLGNGISRRGGVASTAQATNGNVGALIEMISMINGGGSYNTLKRDVDSDEEEEILSKRDSCEAASLEYLDCCKIEID